MMRNLIWVLGLMVAPALAAQADSGVARDSAVRDRLQQEIERRFGAVVQRQLDLSDDQAAKLRATMQRFQPRRRAIARQHALLRMSLQDQMRPGEAADPDSVRRLMDAMQANRSEALKLDQEQDREMAGYLTPVQRARFQMLRERLQERVQEIQRRRAARGADPDLGPRRRQRP